MSVSKDSSQPIYIKVADDFRKQILDGILKPNDKIPSVRELAMTIMINPNTVQKAYSQLEREGYIYVVTGKGNFVSENINEIKKEAIKEANEELKCDVLKLMSLGVSRENIIKEVEKIKGGKK